MTTPLDILNRIRSTTDNLITADDLQPEYPQPRQCAPVCGECSAPLNEAVRCDFCNDAVCPACGCCACHCGGWS